MTLLIRGGRLNGQLSRPNSLYIVELSEIGVFVAEGNGLDVKY